MEKITCRYGKYLHYMAGVIISPQLLYQRKETLYQEYKEDGCTPGLVWTCVDNLTPPGTYAVE
jgi:hypothetical protein